MNFENRPSGKNAIFRDQIVTNEDLLTFKSDLITEIKSIAKDLQDNGGKKWLRSKDVRKMLGISPGTLQNLRINGHLPFNKVGGVIFYDRDDIYSMIESNRFDNSI
jgi:hypothetical protein